MPEDGSVVVLTGGDLQGGGGVGLAALVPGDDLNLSGVEISALGDVEVPHAVVDQLVLASLRSKGMTKLNFQSPMIFFCVALSSTDKLGFEIIFGSTES